MGAANKKKTFWTAKSMHTIHGWLGYKLSILLFIICFTGSLATISYEMDWLINPALRVDAEDKPFAWQAMQDNYAGEYPDGYLLFLEAPLYSNFAAIGMAVEPEKGTRRILFNPYSGKIVANMAHYASAQRIIRDIHRQLLYPVGGTYIVGLFAFVLLGILITSLLIYKKWWRGFFKLPRKKNQRLFLGDIHRLAGVWSLWFVAVIAVTGIWYFAEELLAGTSADVQIKRPAIEGSELSNYGAAPAIISLGEALQETKTLMPDLEVKSISFPFQAGRPYFITGYRDTFLARDRANHIFIDPFSGTVMKYQKAESQSAFERWVDMADPIHFGNFAGLVSKVIWFFFGLLLPTLALVGVWLWQKRVQKLIAKEIDLSAPKCGQKVSTSYLGKKYNMGVWKSLAITVATVGLLIGSGIAVFQSGVFYRHPTATHVGSLQVGAWDAAVFVLDADGDGFSEQVRLGTACENCVPNYKSAEVGFYAYDGTVEFMPLELSRTRFLGGISSELVLPANKQVIGYSLKITDWAGKVYSARFPVGNF
ncbi:MAG: PepSY domain-containing protein [Kordiimonadaceae bacterium]|nr:PepSY domain-containing protein [Kordiimonadaceae bacterium]